MCYSAEASFTASIVLAGIGYATVKETPRSSMLPLALLPWLFGIQQFAEGIVWLQLRGDISPSTFSYFAKNVYLFAAYMLWPIWIPFSLLIMEKVYVKRVVLGIIFFVGIYVAIHNYINLVPFSIEPKVMGHSVQYEVGAKFYKALIYIAIVVLPCFISSVRYMSVFGFLLLASSLLTYYFYTVTFTSVWCFAGAILCLGIYWIIRLSDRE